MRQSKFFKSFGQILLFGLFFIVFTGATRNFKKPKPLPLTSIHIIDRNGFAETISSKDRITQFQNLDFLKPQPYQKVLLVYGRDSLGNMRSVATTYYANGNPKQFLEILNGRANGIYTEWHENGVCSLSSHAIGGIPDLTPAAEKSWIFHGISCVWDEDGNLKAEICYDQGALNGISTYYHSCGQIWKCIPFEKNQINGKVEIFKRSGELLSQISFQLGRKNGKSVRYWSYDCVAHEEEYCQNKLINAQYYDQHGRVIAEVKNGYGFRAIFSKNGVRELQEINDGHIDGEVKVFDADGLIKRIYHVKDCVKHGEETEFYPKNLKQPHQPNQPKISFNWHEGKIHGITRTWYSNGNMESQKEMSNNKKNGVLSAWYKDGNLMMIEEYEENKLVRGEYYKKSERIPISQIIAGKGIATIYDAEGNFVQKITYLNGKPEPK
jgi:antitoxin component YwqK of YwqJK toxin-antitoxin module